MSWQKVFYNNIAAYISLINEKMENEFPLESLSNHIKVQGGYSFKANEYRSEGIPVIRISDFQDEKIDLSAVRYYKEDKVFDKFQLYSGDIIIAMTGGTIGKLAIVQEGLGKLYLNQRVGKFSVLNPDDFEPEYIYWLARGIQDKVKNLGYGGAQPNVSNGQIEALKFPFPDKKRQQQIIEFLNDLKENNLKDKVYFDLEVEKNIINYQSIGLNLFKVLTECDQQQIYVHQLRRAILQEAVQGKLTKQNKDDEPANKLLQRIQTEKQELIKEGKLKKEKEFSSITEVEMPFEIPKGWVWCRWNDLLSTDKYSMKRGPFGSSLKKEMFVEKGIRVFEQYNPINDDPYWARYYITEEKYKELEAFTAVPGDLLISCSGATLGRITEISEDAEFGIINQALLKLTLNKTIVSNSYFLVLFRSPFLQEKILEEAGGSAIPNMVGVSVLKQIVIPLPSLSEQHRIVAKVEQLMQMVNKLEQQMQQSQAQAGQLLQAVLKETFAK